MRKYTSKLLTNFIDRYSELRSLDDKNALWNNISTPIIEEILNDTDNVLVTFLYRLPSSHINCTVYVYSAVTGLVGSDAGKMSLVSNTDIAYLSLKLPKALRTTYSFLLVDQTAGYLNPKTALPPAFYPALIGEVKKSDELFSALLKNQCVKFDTKNQHRIIYYMDMDNPLNIFHQESVLECPLAPQKENAYKIWEFNQAERHQLKLKGQFIAELYDFSSSFLNNDPEYKNTKRPYWIYLPPNYNAQSESAYPIMIFLDGIAYAIPVPEILDELILDGLIPPCVAVFLESADNRMKEYNCNEKFTDFLANNFIENLHEKKLNITRSSEYVTIMGSSFSGLAAFFAATKYPKIFGNVIAQSPSFELKKSYELKKFIDEHAAQCRNVNFMLQVGTYETIPVELLFEDGSTQSLSSLDAIETVFEIMKRNALRVAMDKYCGGHDYVCWYSLLPNLFKRIYLKS